MKSMEILVGFQSSKIRASDVRVRFRVEVIRFINVGLLVKTDAAEQMFIQLKWQWADRRAASGELRKNFYRDESTSGVEDPPLQSSMFRSLENHKSIAIRYKSKQFS